MENIKKILIIDDDPAMTFVISALLKRINNIEVIDFNDAKEAIVFYQNCNEVFHSVFIDIYQPTMSGFDILNELSKNLKFWKDKPKVILMSGNIEDHVNDLIEVKKDITTVELIGKPISSDILKRLVA